MATRIHVRALNGAEMVLSDVYASLSKVCPDDAQALLLAAEAIPIDARILQLAPLKNLWIEVPAQFLSDEAGLELAGQMHLRGFPMVLSGRPREVLPATLLPAFKMALVHVDDDRRLHLPPGAAKPPTVKRSIPYAQLGVTAIEMMERSFEAGAVAVVGWPFADTLSHTSTIATSPDIAAVSRLMQLIARDADVSEMEAVIRRDPALAYKLLRFINSPAFGLRVEIQSFGHAVAMLGYTKLRRWLALLIAGSAKQSNLRPIMFASFRRGLFLEHLVGNDESTAAKDELFLLGAFSFLDKLYRESFDKLLGHLNVPESVFDALIHGTGPYAPYVKIAYAIEQGPSPDLPDLLDHAFLSVEQCNTAVMRALATPDLLAE